MTAGNERPRAAWKNGLMYPVPYYAHKRTSVCGSGLCLHTQTCVWINTRSMCAPCPFLEGEQGDMCKDTHIYPLYSDNFLFTHAPPQKAKQASHNGTEHSSLWCKGYMVQLMRLFQTGHFPAFLSDLPHSRQVSIVSILKIKKKTKISPRKEHVRVSQEKVCST